MIMYQISLYTSLRSEFDTSRFRHKREANSISDVAVWITLLRCYFIALDINNIASCQMDGLVQDCNNYSLAVVLH